MQNRSAAHSVLTPFILLTMIRPCDPTSNPLPDCGVSRLVTNYMIYGKTWIKWLLILVGLGSIVYIISSNNNKAHIPPAPTAAPVLSSIVQTGFTTIYWNSGPRIMLQITNDLNRKENFKELESGFPYGYIILGLQNGQVAYQLHLKDISIHADWDNAILSFSTEGNWGYVYIPGLQITSLKNYSKFDKIDAGQYFPLEYPDLFRWNLSTNPIIPCAFLKVLDQENKLLLIGFDSNR
jgi:hypothetical protein